MCRGDLRLHGLVQEEAAAAALRREEDTGSEGLKPCWQTLNPVKSKCQCHQLDWNQERTLERRLEAAFIHAGKINWVGECACQARTKAVQAAEDRPYCFAPSNCQT